MQCEKPCTLFCSVLLLMHILASCGKAMNVVVPGVLCTPGAAHPAAVYSVREDGAAGYAHCGHRQCEVIAG